MRRLLVTGTWSYWLLQLSRSHSECQPLPPRLWSHLLVAPLTHPGLCVIPSRTLRTVCGPSHIACSPEKCPCGSQEESFPRRRRWGSTPVGRSPRHWGSLCDPQLCPEGATLWEDDLHEKVKESEVGRCGDSTALSGTQAQSCPRQEPSSSLQLQSPGHQMPTLHCPQERWAREGAVFQL